MNSPRELRYSFETKPTRQTEEQARRMLRTFLNRLRIGSDVQEELPAQDAQDLLTFATTCHLNISWYDRHRRREQRWYWGFAFFTFLVLAGTPLAIFWAHYVDARALTAQVGVIIAGVLSAHRMLSTMFEKRNLVRHFWRAEADLKSILYAFEDRWRGRAVASRKPLALHDEFLDDLRAQIGQARQIKRQEQDEFFARYDTAYSNLHEVLGTTQRTAAEATSVFAIQRARRAEKLAEARAEVDELEAQSAAIARQLSELERELAAADGAASPAHEARRAAITGRMDSLHGDRLDIQLRLVAARSMIAHLERR